MTETELQRPQMKINATPLTEEDKYFLPYVDRGSDVLPSERDSWKSDEKSKAFMKAIAEGKDLTDTDWTGINLKGADLSGANLYGVNLSKANLTGVNLSGANLEWTNLSYAYCEETNFSNANMKNTQMKGVFYKNCNIDGADIDEDTMKYLSSVKWFLSQIESGKIKLESIPSDQLYYLDLRTIDMRRVEIPENIDLSALILEGVNLSGVYIPRGHLLNLALMEKNEKRTNLIMKKKQKALDLTYERLKHERKDAIEAYGKEQKNARLQKRAYAEKLTRPKKKTTATVTTTQTDVKTSSGSANTKNKPLRRLIGQAKRLKAQNINSKKRT